MDKGRGWAGIPAAGRTAHSRGESDTHATPKGHSLTVGAPHLDDNPGDY